MCKVHGLNTKSTNPPTGRLNGVCCAAPQGMSRRAAQRPPSAAPRARSAQGTLRRPPAHQARWPVRRHGCRRQSRLPLPAAAPPCGPPGCTPRAPRSAQHARSCVLALRLQHVVASPIKSPLRMCCGVHKLRAAGQGVRGGGAMHNAAVQLPVTPTTRCSACQTSLEARVAYKRLEREKAVCIVLQREHGQSHCVEKAGDGAAHSLYSVASWLPAPYALSWLHSASCTDARSASSNSSAPACTQPQLCRNTEHKAQFRQTCKTHIYAHPS